MKFLKSIKNRAMRRAKDESGDVLVIVAVGMVALLSMVSFSVDVGLTQYQRSKIQTACDSAALAAVHDISKGRTVVESTALRYLRENGYPDSRIDTNDVQVSIEAGSRVRVSKKFKQKTFFATMMGADHTDCEAKSVAVVDETSIPTRVEGKYSLYVGEGNVTLGGNPGQVIAEDEIHVEDNFGLSQYGFRFEGGITIGGYMSEGQSGANNQAKSNWNVKTGVKKEMPNYTPNFVSKIQKYLTPGKPDGNADANYKSSESHINWVMGTNYFNTWAEYCNYIHVSPWSSLVEIKDNVRIKENLNNIPSLKIAKNACLVAENGINFGWGASQIDGMIFSYKDLVSNNSYKGDSAALIAYGNIKMMGGYSRIDTTGDSDNLYVCSLYGNVNFTAGSTDLYGIIYCPNGSTGIQGNGMKFHGNVITKRLSNNIPSGMSFYKNDKIDGPAGGGTTVKSKNARLVE